MWWFKTEEETVVGTLEDFRASPIEPINLGDLVVDIVSGFRGIAVSKHSYLMGCDRFSIQPEVNDKGEMSDPQSFDEGQLRVVETARWRRRLQNSEPGGPDKYPDTAKTEGSRKD